MYLIHVIAVSSELGLYPLQTQSARGTPYLVKRIKIAAAGAIIPESAGKMFLHSYDNLLILHILNTKVRYYMKRNLL